LARKTNQQKDKQTERIIDRETQEYWKKTKFLYMQESQTDNYTKNRKERQKAERIIDRWSNRGKDRTTNRQKS